MRTGNGAEPAAREPLGLGARVVGVLTSPRETFERVMDDPRWVAILALSVGCTAVPTAALLMTDAAQQALVDQQVSTMESFGSPVSDEVRAELRQGVGIAAYAAFGSILVGAPLVSLLLAGLLYGAGYGLLGAEAGFGRTFSVVAHAGVVFAVQTLFVAPLNYARGSMEPPTTLGAFAPMLAEETFAYRLLGAVDLFNVWWIMILSIGLAVAWKRRTTPVAFTLYGIYAGIVLLTAVLRASLGF